MDHSRPMLALVLLCGPWLGGGPAVRGADADAIQRAISAGVAYLKNAQHPDGMWLDIEYGNRLLTGLALLECGLALDDPRTVRLAALTRQNGVKLNYTYHLALAILFLDRLQDPRDRRLIESMGVRLLAGQQSNGGWHYWCPPVPDAEVTRLVADMPLEPRKQLALYQGQRVAAELLRPDDNSNTQFAVLGLWTARRYGVPVADALGRVTARFRTMQNQDGGWAYQFRSLQPGQPPRDHASSPGMTCAGLLGMATAYGASTESALRTAAAPMSSAVRSALTGDKTVRDGLLYLADSMNAQMAAALDRERKLHYFLWSLERVGMAYGVPTIGGKDWHNWGADLLLASQSRAGYWPGGFHETSSTSFALLFLRRSNLTPDLTALLKGQLRDPGERVLKAGTVASDKTSVDVQQLVSDLTSAETARQQRALENLRDGKGPEYTEGLAEVIGKLDGTLKGKAREALTDRLSRMTPATLRDKLAEGNAEVRRAAALAVASRDEQGLIPDVLKLLEDRNEDVIRAARAALRAFSGKDFGPQPGAGPLARTDAVKAWRAWWEKQGEKKP